MTNDNDTPKQGIKNRENAPGDLGDQKDAGTTSAERQHMDIDQAPAEATESGGMGDNGAVEGAGTAGGKDQPEDEK